MSIFFGVCWRSLSMIGEFARLRRVSMPRLDGYRLCRMLKFDQRWKAIPVIHVTSKGGAEAQAISREVGVEGMLRKPFTMDEMHETLSEYPGRGSGGFPQPAGRHSGEN